MFWIALHCPLLSLESFRATLGAADAARPVVLIAAHRLVAVDAVAAERGLEPGMRRATALALAPDLLPGEADAARDAAALTALAHAALAFTPMVVVEPPATVLLEVRASLRCFGGGVRLLQRLLAAAGPLGHRLQVASAPTPLAASLLARWRGDFAAFMLAPGDRLAALHDALADAPLALLGSARPHHDALQAMGLRSVADLQTLPRDGLARRFGAALLDDLDRALGSRPDPRQPLLPPEVFASRLELFARADTSAQVLHGAGVLLARLVAWAQARQVRIAAFTLRMRHEPRHRGDAPEATPLRLELAEPSLAIDHLSLLLRERLGRLELAAPTLELDLECRDTVHAPAPNAELFPTRQAETQGLVRLLERLRARLGDEQVLQLVPQTDHRPECASRLLPVAAVPRPPGRRRSAAAARAATLQRPVPAVAAAATARRGPKAGTAAAARASPARTTGAAVAPLPAGRPLAASQTLAVGMPPSARRTPAANAALPAGRTAHDARRMPPAGATPPAARLPPAGTPRPRGQLPSAAREADPAVPTIGQAAPTSHPALPVTSPTLPSRDPAVPMTNRAAQVNDPAAPVTSPTVPSRDPAVPMTNPAAPMNDPARPVTGAVPPAMGPAKPMKGRAPPMKRPAVPMPGPEQDPAAIAAALLARAGLAAPCGPRRAASHRPVWLSDAPQPLAERDERPTWRGRPIRLLAGPERLESGWWDGGLAVRDYFVAQVDDGALVWVYRTRLCDAADDAAGGWFLQGWFG